MRADAARRACLAVCGALALAAQPAAAQPRKAKSRPPAAAAAPTPWAGEWSGPWCGEAIGGGPAAGGCGTFSLTLVQRRDRICGRHEGVAPGGRRLVGDAQSAIGKVKGGRATIVVTAGSPLSSWLVQAERSGREMRWRVVERVAAADAGARPTDLPASATLGRARDKGPGDAARAECRAHFADPD